MMHFVCTTFGSSGDVFPFLGLALELQRRGHDVTAMGLDKIYDGTTAAAVTLSDDRVNGDNFTDTYTGATFADKNVGTAKAISVSGISLSGAGVGN